MNNEHYYQLFMQLLNSGKRFTRADAAKFMGIGEKHVTRMAKRLTEAGYDMDAWNAKMRANVGNLNNPPVKVEKQKKLTNERYYAALMKALDSPDSYRIKHVAGDMLGLSTREVRRVANRLREAGFDMSEWDYKMRLNQRKAYRTNKVAEERHARNVPQPATPQNESVILNRAKWLADMRSVADKAEPRRELEAIWKVNGKTVHSRITIIRRAGYDMSWWIPSPSKGFGNADAELKARLEGVKEARTKRQEIAVIQAQKLEQEITESPVAHKWVPRVELIKGRICYAEIPYTIHSIAEIAGVSVNRARFIARGLGVPFSAFMLSREIALKVLDSLGFNVSEVAA